jgi:hypothetical protein
MPAKRIRDGKGHRAYRRQLATLKRRTKELDLPCDYGSPSGWGCGEHIATDLDPNDRMAFTADHDEAIANGGKLVGQVLVPMHRRCNSMKGDSAAVEIWVAT